MDVSFSFRIVLLIVGVLIIAGILIHGLMSIRKPKKGKLRQEAMDSVKHNRRASDVEPESEDVPHSRDQQGFDAHGVGVVRVVKKNDDAVDAPEAPLAPVRNDGEQAPSLNNAAPGPQERITPRLDLDAAARVADEMGVPSFSAQNDNTDTAETDSPALGIDEPAATADVVSVNKNTVEPTPPKDVLVLNVVAHQGNEISGAVLLPTLLTLGLKYGEMQIFHRHQDSAGNGEVLFSLANMVKPGVFDIDNMETFTTQGVSLFMTLPCASDNLETFNLMLSAAAKLAEELDGQVLDGNRCVLTKQSTQHYVQRIRDVERDMLLMK